MTIAKIIAKFQKKGYKVVRCNSSIVITDPRGFKKSFSSYNAAYKSYF